MGPCRMSRARNDSMHEPLSILQTEQVLHAGCKANLYLLIKEKRPDGLHELESFFLPLPAPSDTIRVRQAQAGQGLCLRCSMPELAGRNNSIAAAWRLYGERTGFYPDLEVFLEKGIPVGAGLGGGSSDAAVMLRLLNDLAPPEVGLKEAGLQEVAARIGADVPFFLMNRPAWAEGAGERLHPVDVDLPDCCLLVVCPDEQISTREAYHMLDASRSVEGLPSGNGALTTAANTFTGSLRFTGRLFFNSFETVIFGAYPALGALKRELLKRGASGAVLSGSGAALLAAFVGKQEAESAAAFLQEHDVSCYTAEHADWGVAKR